MMLMINVSENIRIYTENTLLHKINKSNGKIVKTNVLTLGISQKFVTISGMFLQRKWLNLDKNKKSCSVSTCTIFNSPYQLHSSIENQQSTITIKN